MRLILLNLFFLLLLAASLGAKVHTNLGGGLAASDPDDADIIALFGRHDFAVTHAEPHTDPVWITGRRGDCVIDIATVSPRGWHSTVVNWRANGRKLRYAVGDALLDQQPILRPTIVHYLNRLKRYAGIDAPAVKVRAVVSAPECPVDAIPMTELAALSN